MAVKIRLSRVGKKKVPFYRVVAIDSRRKRDGQFIEDLGTYNALTGELVQFHQDRIAYWISQGAIPTDSVLKLKRMYAKQKSSAASV